MWKHVADQMKFPGGLGQKREDWVEHHHQITSRIRAQFGKTHDKAVKATAKERRHQQITDPNVVAYDNFVHKKAKRGRRKNHVSMDEKRRE